MKRDFSIYSDINSLSWNVQSEDRIAGTRDKCNKHFELVKLIKIYDNFIIWGCCIAIWFLVGCVKIRDAYVFCK